MYASITIVNQVILLLNFGLSNNFPFCRHTSFKFLPEQFEYTIIGITITQATFHYFPSLGLRECVVISML